MTIPYIKLFGDSSATVDLLSDAEAGRLLKSLLHYANGQADDLPGQEKLVFAMLKAQIDRDAVSYQEFLDKQRENGKKGGRPKNPSLFTENPKNPSLFTETQKTQEEDKDKEEDIKVKVKDARAREEMPFGITGEEIHASLARDSQIEDAAKSAGLNTSETAMVTARRYADEYGLEKLLDAIKETPLKANRPSWAYVEGILKGNGGKPNDNRRNRGADTEEPRRGKYSFLFDGTEAV